MEIQTIDGALLAKMFLAGAKNLETKKEWINELNVFPVPDGDTGTNMCLTIMSAVREVSQLDAPVMSDLAKAIASGSLRGARGNSGVILSQLFRGFTKVIAQYETLDKKTLCDSFQRACETAYKAVMKPKEGTILTVARGAAEKALELAEDDSCDLRGFICGIAEEAERVLATTPDLLPVLKQAGVVDSGGQGLVEILKGARDAFLGRETGYAVDAGTETSRPMKISQETEAEIRFGYCTEFIIVLNRPLQETEESELKGFLQSMGDSIVMVADEEIVKIHVHTNDPGLVLQKALTLGSLSRIKIDNMREEHQEKLFKDAERLAKEQAAADAASKASVTGAQNHAAADEASRASVTGAQNHAAAGAGTEASEEVDLQSAAQADAEIGAGAGTQTEPETADGARTRTAGDGLPPKEVGFITICIGDGLKEVFRELGADCIIEGGQTMNPSTEDLLKAIDQVNADTVFIFPNNSNIILTANQAAAMTRGKNVTVIPTSSIPQGITALINYIPEQSAKENEETMREVIATVKTGQITYAVRDTVVGDKEIREGDYMGVGDHTIFSAGSDMQDVAKDMVARLIDAESAFISVYYGEGVSAEAAEALGSFFEQTYPECEVEVKDGGQPVYYYIISVE